MKKEALIALSVLAMSVTPAFAAEPADAAAETMKEQTAQMPQEAEAQKADAAKDAAKDATAPVAEQTDAAAEKAADAEKTDAKK